MPGKHSPEKLAARRERALARVFLRPKSFDRSITSSGEIVSEPMRVDFDFVDTCSSDHFDKVYYSDPWASKVPGMPPPLAELNANAEPFFPAPSPPSGDTQGSTSSEDSLHNAFALIARQNDTIAKLTGEVEYLRTLVPYRDVGYTSRPTSMHDLSCRLSRAESNMKQLASSLGDAVKLALDSRIGKEDLWKGSSPSDVDVSSASQIPSSCVSLPNFVTIDRFQTLETLVKYVCTSVGRELDATVNKLRNEMAETFSKILKKQIQQHDDIAELHLKCSAAHVSVDSSSVASLCGARETGTRSDDQESVPILVHPQEARRQPSCKEFLEMAAIAKARLPHLQEMPRQVLMITDSLAKNCDTESIGSNATSELPSEHDFFPLGTFRHYGVDVRFELTGLDELELELSPSDEQLATFIAAVNAQT